MPTISLTNPSYGPVSNPNWYDPSYIPIRPLIHTLTSSLTNPLYGPVSNPNWHDPSYGPMSSPILTPTSSPIPVP